MQLGSPSPGSVSALGALTLFLAAVPLLFAGWMAFSTAVSDDSAGLGGLIYFAASIIGGLAAVGAALAGSGIAARTRRPRLALGLVIAGLLLCLLLLGSFAASAISG